MSFNIHVSCYENLEILQKSKKLCDLSVKIRKNVGLTSEVLVRMNDMSITGDNTDTITTLFILFIGTFKNDLWMAIISEQSWIIGETFYARIWVSIVILR